MKARYEVRDTEVWVGRVYPSDRQRMAKMRERLQVEHPDRLVRVADVVKLMLDSAEAARSGR